jgi:hypothetical protein
MGERVSQETLDGSLDDRIGTPDNDTAFDELWRP